MRAITLVGIFLVTFTSGSSMAQGHYEANPQQTIKVERSHEYKAEGKEYKKVVPVTMEFNTGACKADLRLEYFQKGANAHVKSTLSNEQCGASAGNYTIRVQYRDAEGNTKLLEFDETWNRDDDADVASEKDYFIGDDIDIMRIKSRNLSCHCEEPAMLEEQSDNSESSKTR